MMMVRSDAWSALPHAVASVLALLAISGALAAPRPDLEDYHIVQRRAALVLDRLLVAMERALHDEAAYRMRSTRHATASAAYDGPRTAALRGLPSHNPNSRMLRGNTGSSLGRAVQCYFNAITCF